MADETKLIKKLINYPESIVNQVEDYRFENRLPNFSAAVIELIQKGLEASKQKEPVE